MTQAIITKFLGPTNTRPSRIKATGWRGNVTVPYNHGISPVSNYRSAVQTLCDKFNRMDRATWKIIEYAELPNEARDLVFIIDWVRVP
jgi:hypothetical protein